MAKSTPSFHVVALFGCIALVAAFLYQKRDLILLTCVPAAFDGNRYCVRSDRADVPDAADLLARVANKCSKLVEYTSHKYKDDPDVERLKARFDPSKICETLPSSEHTAYSENKGEKIAFCLHTSKEGNTFIDENTLTFVALHELAHVMTVSEGHTRAFWRNFKFLLVNAVETKLYTPEDYKKSPRQYCGMSITDNPYLDT